jgi:hypothetical protein
VTSDAASSHVDAAPHVSDDAHHTHSARGETTQPAHVVVVVAALAHE